MEQILLLIVIPLLMIAYFELLGRTLVSRLYNNRLYIYFPIGFICFLGILYPTSLLINYGVSFYVLLIIILLALILSFFFIINNFKNIDKKINYVAFLFDFAICIVLSYFSYNTTLGNLNGFDTVHYLNMVSQNIGLKHLNSKDIYLNTVPPGFSMTYYTNEVYYYFVGALLFCLSKCFSLLKIDFYYGTSFIWLFQILFNCSIGSIVVESFKKVNTKISYFVCSFLIIFVLAKIYYNNVFGFFGNSWYTIVLSYLLLFIIDYINYQDESRFLIYILLLGMCSFTSSGIYTSIFILFGLFFFSKNPNCIKEYALVLLLPIFNALFMERLSLTVNIILPFGIMCICCVVGKYIFELLNKNNNKKIFLILCIILLFILSRKYSNGLFDFTGFFNNLSQRQDMTLNYFNIDKDNLIISFYKIFVVSAMMLNFILNYKKTYVMFFLVIVITFFNPFNCNFINRYISVYYRAYSIFFNPFMIIIMYDDLVSLIKYKYVIYSLSLIIILFLFLNVDFINPMIYHYQFNKDDSYNAFYKMKDDEIDIIKQLKDNIYYYKNKNPYIITGNLLTLSMLPQGKYLYGKSNYQYYNWSKSEKELYAIFYTPEYLGDHIKQNPNYNNMLKYITDANVDYIVVDKTVEYYDETLKKYSYLYLKVNEVCSIFPIYENSSYALYCFFNY